MAQLDQLKTNFKDAQSTFQNGLNNLREGWEAKQIADHGGVRLDALNQESPDFSLYYCLSESLTQLERKIAEKPSRELSLVKTKLQEALFWAEQAH